ncbi:MAG: hypothetical protein J7L21_00205, partial [Sulfurimonas sp.]|nr:hypothetical protein [Sulfurimonas sp.]
MLKFFDANSHCNIIVDYPINSNDITRLEKLFYENYISWHVEFGRVYSVSENIINILYREIFKNSKKILITTNKYKLNHYFHKLGFRTNFKSLIKDDVLHVDDIEVILIGGSADSSSKVMDIVKNTILNNLTIVVVQHVESDGVQLFDSILQKYTKHKVCYAKDGEKIKKGVIYLAPHNKHLKVEYGHFFLSDEEKYNFAKPSVSISYESFSSYYKKKLLIIQECGYASDGVDKLEYIKENNSKLIIQDKDECQAKSMVINAFEIGVHDYVLNSKNIINYINFLDKRVDRNSWIEYLLEMIFEKYGYDFRLYQRAMVKRRLDIFMLKHGVSSIKNAVGVILFNRSAFKGFFLEVSINVTELFRKPKSFKYITDFLNTNYNHA